MDKFNRLAMDKNGTHELYGNKPKKVIQSEMWSDNECSRKADTFKSFKAGTCDWEDSLVERS